MDDNRQNQTHQKNSQIEQSNQPNADYRDYWAYMQIQNKSENGKSIASLVCGCIAIFLSTIFPVPMVGLILGVVGIVMAVLAKKEGAKSGVQTAGFIVSIIGTVFGAFIVGAIALAIALFMVAGW